MDKNKTLYPKIPTAPMEENDVQNYRLNKINAVKYNIEKKHC